MKLLLSISLVVIAALAVLLVRSIQRENQRYWEGVVAERVFYQSIVDQCVFRNGTAMFHVEQQQREIERLRIAGYDVQTKADKQFHRQLEELVKNSPNGTVCVKMQ
jgi:hypothetical protein